MVLALGAIVVIERMLLQAFGKSHTCEYRKSYLSVLPVQLDFAFNMASRVDFLYSLCVNVYRGWVVHCNRFSEGSEEIVNIVR